MVQPGQWTSDYLYLWFILIMNASKMWKNDQVPGDDCTQKIPYLKCHEKFEKINSSHNSQASLLSRL